MKRFLALAGALCLFALPLAAQAAKHTPAAMGAMPSCSAGDPVVWVNTRTKVYHMSGDSYYGKTKTGKYACKSDAVAMGAHASGRMSKHGAMSGGAMSGGAMSGASAPDDTATPMAGTMKHRKHRGAMPMPTATP